MKVKKFSAKDMPEAMKQIRAELGDHAVILNSRPVDKGGFFGLFTKKNMEVIAAVDENQLRPSSPPQKPVLENKKKSFVREPSSAPDSVDSSKKLYSELTELKKQIASISDNSSAEQPEYPYELQNIDNKLKQQEVTGAFRSGLINDLRKRWYKSDEEMSAAEVRHWAETYIIDQLNAVSFGPASTPKKMINLVGPTGVGKTTTLAKIAAYYHLEQKKSVAFITTDTFRIAAVEQLKTYAKILDLPIEVAYSVDDFKQAKEKFESFDLILVDSAGRNFLNRLYVDELRKVIDFDEDMDTYLVLALTSKYKDMKKIVDQFSLLPIDKFIFTKKDETSSYGAMINMISETNIGAAYVTTGQNVPDDMVNPVPETIAGWVMKETADD